MNKTIHGNVVPFALPAHRLRRSAEDYRKRGQPIEAVSLLRRAAEQEDSVMGWLRLAQQLRRMNCQEQASVILYRLCARRNMLPEVWLELGKCQQVLGRKDAAIDCLYHYLSEDPYSEGAEAARAMLEQLETPEETHRAFRHTALIRRGLASYRRGEKEAGVRRIRRAIRMSKEKAPLYITLAVLFLAEGKGEAALVDLAHALRHDPGNVRAMSMMCVTLSSLNKRRMAMAMLERCAEKASEPNAEEYFLTAAWTITADRITRAYLEKQLKQKPYRIALMHHMAVLCWQEGQSEDAQRWWKRILSLDPQDQRARAMILWAPEHPDMQIPMMGALPGDVVKQYLAKLLTILNSDMPADVMLAYGSESRAILDWCMNIPDIRLQSMALNAIGEREGDCVQAYLREMLIVPGTISEVRQKAMLRLAEMGDTGPLNILMGQRITTAQMTRVEAKPRGQWTLFLPQLLRETRRTCESQELAFFAADLWTMLTPAQQREAVGPKGYQWLKAIEILYLRLTGREEAAEKIVRGLPVSPRKISRILRGVKRQTDISMEGDVIS